MRSSGRSTRRTSAVFNVLLLVVLAGAALLGWWWLSDGRHDRSAAGSIVKVRRTLACMHVSEALGAWR